MATNQIVLTPVANTTNWLFRFSRNFKSGEIANVPRVAVNGTPVTTQSEVVKTHAGDASCRRSRIVAEIPALSTGVPVTITFVDQASAPAGIGMTTAAAILAAYPQLECTITGTEWQGVHIGPRGVAWFDFPGTGSYSVSMRALIAAEDFTVVQDGPFMTEILVQDLTGAGDVGLHGYATGRPRFRVQLFPDGNWKCWAVIHNGNLEAYAPLCHEAFRITKNVTSPVTVYDHQAAINAEFALSGRQPNANTPKLYLRAGCRIAKEFWGGTEPAHHTIDWGLDYVSEEGSLDRMSWMGAGNRPPASFFTTRNAAWATPSDRGFFGARGLLRADSGTASGSAPQGFLTEVECLWLMQGNKASHDVMRQYTEMAFFGWDGLSLIDMDATRTFRRSGDVGTAENRIVSPFARRAFSSARPWLRDPTFEGMDDDGATLPGTDTTNPMRQYSGDGSVFSTAAGTADNVGHRDITWHSSVGAAGDRTWDLKGTHLVPISKAQAVMLNDTELEDMFLSMTLFAATWGSGWADTFRGRGPVLDGYGVLSGESRFWGRALECVADAAHITVDATEEANLIDSILDDTRIALEGARGFDGRLVSDLADTEHAVYPWGGSTHACYQEKMQLGGWEAMGWTQGDPGTDHPYPHDNRVVQNNVGFGSGSVSQQQVAAHIGWGTRTWMDAFCLYGMLRAYRSGATGFSKLLSHAVQFHAVWLAHPDRNTGPSVKGTQVWGTYTIPWAGRAEVPGTHAEGFSLLTVEEILDGFPDGTHPGDGVVPWYGLNGWHSNHAYIMFGLIHAAVAQDIATLELFDPLVTPLCPMIAEFDEDLDCNTLLYWEAYWNALQTHPSWQGPELILGHNDTANVGFRLMPLAYDPDDPGTPLVGSVAAPGVPASLDAIVNATTVELTWSPPTDGGPVTEYRLQSAIGATPIEEDFEDVAVVEGLDYTDAVTIGLGDAVTYRVRAEGTGGNSAYVTVVATRAAPPAPMGLSVIPLSPTAAFLTFGAPAAGEFGPPETYRIQRAAGLTPAEEDFSDIVELTPGDDLEHTDTTTAGAAYTWRVRAEYAASANSAWVTESATMPDVAPNSPTSVAATSSDPAEIDLTWAAPSGGGTVAEYLVEYAPQSTGIFTALDPIPFDADPLAAAITGLTGGVIYTVRIRAENSLGVGGSLQVSPWVSIDVATSGALPGAPVIVFTTDSALEADLLVLRNPTDAIIPAEAIDYEVDWNLNLGAAGPWSDLATQEDDPEFTHPDLEVGTYYYRARVINTAGAGPWSAAVNFSTDGVRPAAPGNLTVVSAGNTSVSLSWTHAGGATSFLIFRSATSTAIPSFSLIGTAQGFALAFTDQSGIVPGTTYHYAVFSVSAGGTSDASTVVSALALSLPTHVSGFAAAQFDHDTIRLTWPEQPNVTAYVIERSAVVSGAWVVIGTALATGTYDDSVGLSIGVNYYYRIRAVNARGVGPASHAGPVSLALFAADPIITSVVSLPGGPVVIRWDALPFVPYVLFTIERTDEYETDPIEWDEIGTAAGSAGVFEDATVTHGSEYAYRITSTTLTGSSISEIFVVTALTSNAGGGRGRGRGRGRGMASMAMAQLLAETDRDR